MSRKKRFLKIAGITLAVLLFLGYFGFSTFLFKPFESAWPHPLTGLIPRQVDFFLGKEGLEYDFEKFPVLREWEAIEGSKGWRTWSASPEYKAWSEKNNIPGLLEEVRRQTEALPLGLEPLDIFGGKEIAVAGNYGGVGFDKARWMVLGRVGWSGKMAVSALRYPSLLRKAAKQDFQVDQADGIFALSGGTLKTPLYITRVQDVTVIGNDRDLVAKAPALQEAVGTDSLALAGPFNDHVLQVETKTGQKGLQVQLDVGKTFTSLGIDGPWPNTRSQAFSQAFLGRLIQAPSAKDAMGLLRFQNGPQLDLAGSFSSESVTPFQSRLYRVEGFSREDMLRQAARMAPADCALFVYMHGPITDLLAQVFDSVEPAMRSNIEDAVKSTGHFRSLQDLLDSLGGSLRNRLALIVRENDYGPVVARNSSGQEFPAESDGMPVFAVTLVTWTQGQESYKNLNDIRDMVGRNPEKFGLKGYDAANPNDTGYYVFDSDGFPTREFWSPLIPGTGMMATMITDEGHFWITNHERMFSMVRATYYQGGSAGYPRLSEDPRFRMMVEGALDTANLAVWYNPKEAGPTLRKIAKRWAEDNVLSGINWAKERPKVERTVLNERFDGRSIGLLSPKEVDQLQAIVDQRLQEWGEQYRAENTPKVMAKRDREITYIESLDSLLFELKLDQRDFKVALRTFLDLDGE
ncbi:MAG: hypothetical protein R3F17_10775 [Planctomycetota bacterium]